MLKTSNLHKKIFLNISLLIAFSVFAGIQTCFAESVDTSEIAVGFWGIYRLIRNTAVFIGALSIAFCGYHMLTGNSSDYEKYKKIAILSAIAVGVLWALPSVIAFAKNIAKDHAWHPESPGF